MHRRAQFGVELDYDVGRTTVRLHGELDALSTPAFAAVLIAISDRPTPSVTIDLAGLRSCSVGGLRAMTELAARLHARDGRVTIVEPRILARMLDAADLRSLFVLDEGPESLEDLPRGA